MKKRFLILVNLGSPDSFKVSDVRQYLRQFLMDERVIDAPYLVRKMIVEGFVLPFRPKKSAHAYQSVWMEEGAPLKVITENFRKALLPFVDAHVSVAMRYANPTPEAALRELEKMDSNIDEIFIAPLYPHFAMSSYETAYLYVVEKIKSLRPNVKFKILQPFYDESEYINSLSESIAPYLKEDYDHLLFSFHGLPVRHLKKSDPTKKHCYQVDQCCDVKSEAWSLCYKHQVIQTTKLVAAQLKIPAHKFSHSFQSRLGSDEWIKPYTQEKFESLPRQGVKKLLVACPAFVSDCLETLEEIAMRGKETFIAAGGESFTMIPCLNTNLKWVETFAGYFNKSESTYQNLWCDPEEVGK
ncbi:MAG TPA: ferrochelatase [Cytophagales bacterium]|jgi:protoporphyrin/coproporphyrin ferrochelatase|nr:ferrochelatase [Cytophagales bacterium]